MYFKRITLNIQVKIFTTQLFKNTTGSLWSWCVLHEIKEVCSQRGGGQNFERRNAGLTFRNLKIANIKITKNDLFYSFIIKFILPFSEIIWILKIFNNFSNCKILIFQMVEFLNFENSLIFQITKFQIFDRFPN